MTTPPMPSRVPAGATSEGDGIILGDGPVRVDAFIDFLCPYCRRFELSSGPKLATMLAQQFGYVLASILIGRKPTLVLRSKRQGRRAIAVPYIHVGTCGKQFAYRFQVRMLRSDHQ